jgi:hypothetical protein
MLKTFRAFILVSVCVWSVSPLVAAPAGRDALATPAKTFLQADAGYYLWNYYEEPVGLANVSWSADYHLTDGTYLGSASGSWSGNEGQMSSLGSAIATGIGGSLGWAVGWQAGTAAGGWVAGQVAIGAGTGAYAFGIGALAAGPWIGAAAVGALGIA